MKTGRILLALIAVVAIVGGLMAFGASKYSLNKMIAATTLRTDLQKYTLVTGSPDAAHMNSIVRWADVCFSFSGNSTQYNDPSKYIVVPCTTIGGLCEGGPVFCGLKISVANLIHDNGPFNGKPRVDEQAGAFILDLIKDAVDTQAEQEEGGVRAYLKP